MAGYSASRPASPSRKARPAPSPSPKSHRRWRKPPSRQGIRKIMNKRIRLWTAPAGGQVVSRSDCHARNSRAELTVIAERDGTWPKSLRHDVNEIGRRQQVQVRIQITDVRFVTRI